MRALILVLAVCLFASTAAAGVRPWQPQPARPIDATTYRQLLTAVQAESMPDGKLERVRQVTGGRRYLFSAGQVIALLDSFEFWIERAEALRLLPVADRAEAAAILRYFDPAPATTRTEAQRVLEAGP